MSCLWIYLSLLYAATLLTGSVSSNEVSNPGVSLRCNQTVTVGAGDTVTLNCTIHYSNPGHDCKGEKYVWRDTHSEVPCNRGLMKYICEWNTVSYVSLTISNVTEEDNFTVEIETHCGFPKSPAIQVKVNQRSNISNGGAGSVWASAQATNPNVTPALLGIFITLIVLGVLYFLFGTARGRAVIKHIKKEKTPGDPAETDTALERDKSLIA